MSDKTPDTPDEAVDKAKNIDSPQADDHAEKTINEKVTDPEPLAAKEGVEREDAQPSDSLDEVARPSDDTLGTEPEGPMARRAGMWSRGTGDTSGYGGIERQVLRPQASERPYGGWFDAVADRLGELVPAALGRVVISNGEMTVYVPREHLAEAAKQLRDDVHLRFEACMSVSGVHYPDDANAELHAIYHLLSYTHNRRVRLEVTCPDADPHIPSVVATYPMADFHERETWDMFGIVFDGHPHLTRILMPDDWVGHPQRKDYPLGGIPVEFKGAVVPPPDQRRKY